MRQLLRDRKFLHASAVLVGTMIGVGIFGIPFAFAKAGFWVGASWLLVLAGVVCLSNLMFAEVTLATEGIHQMSGYAGIWLGRWGKRLMTLAITLGIYGALLAYLIIFGEFAHNVFSHFIAVDPQLYSVLFGVFWSLLWFLRVRTFAAIELALIGIYSVIILVVAGVSAPHWQTANLSSWIPEYWFLPYGVLLFALGGMSAVPIQRRLLAGRERLLPRAVVSAMVLVTVLYFIFAVSIVAVSGDLTSPEAFEGLFGKIGAPVIILGSVLGMLTIATSFLALGTALFETYHTDFRVRAHWSWLMTMLPPLLLFWSGLRNFIDVIGLIGAVAGGTQGILLIGIWLRARRFRLRTPEFRIRIPSFIAVLVMVLMALGVVHELLQR